jgi:peptidoglycan/xylan/chitin deacetylase (PgdA/CDA1 family)
VDIRAVAVAVVLLAAGRIFFSREAALLGACLLMLAAFMKLPLPAWRIDRPATGVTVLAALLALAAFASTGATTPRATWFGGLTYRGPAGGHMVALTFDDGPNDPYTLEVASILDRYGVKGTFFAVGKALDARPDISRALMDDGHLLGGHSYHHDSVSWLSPGYGEARATQEAFKRDLKVCSAFFRPPHGTHTPFMSHAVHVQGMRVVNWDVSAGDWATRDGALVARRVLKDARPGSIILLHDGLDGDVTSDRSVLLTALPFIIDGLKDRGLRPVRLDELLGGPAYTDCPK